MKQTTARKRGPDLEHELSSVDTQSSLGTPSGSQSVEIHAFMPKNAPESTRARAGISGSPIRSDYVIHRCLEQRHSRDSLTSCHIRNRMNQGHSATSNSSTSHIFGAQSADKGRNISARDSTDDTHSSVYSTSPSTQRNVRMTMQTAEIQHKRPACAWGSVLEQLPHGMPPVYSIRESAFGADSESVRVVLDNLVMIRETLASQEVTFNPHEYLDRTAMQPLNAAGSSANGTNLQRPSGLIPGPSIIDLHGVSSKQLLILCATAIENKNVTIAQQAVWALNSMSSIEGEPSERVTAYFLQALVCRAGNMLDPSLPFKPDHPSSHGVQWTERKLTFNELTSFVDMTPYYRFGYVAANGALLEAFEGMERVHILDFSTTHCMQWPTLIDALADRMDGPPHVRLTVSCATVPTPPKLQSTYQDLGSRLTAFALSKGVPFEFHILPQPLESLQAHDIDLRDGESLGVNCAFRLHYLADESAGSAPSESHPIISEGAASSPQRQPFSAAGSPCPRDKFLRLIRCLNPAVVTLFEEDCDTTSTDLVSRLKESYNYEWMPFDFLATFPPNVNKNRVEYEQNVGRKIENIVSCEGLHRIERLESKDQWLLRMRRLQFRPIPISGDVAAALKDMLDNHAAGWGMKLDEDNTGLLLWKGHSLAFASAWVPAAPPSQPSPCIN